MATPTYSIDTFITNITTALASVAPLDRGKWSQESQKDPPYYVVSLVSIEVSKLQNIDGVNPRPLQGDDHTLHVVCFGATRADCYAMRAALIEAARVERNGRRYRVGTSAWSEEDPGANNGFALAVELVITIDRPHVLLPTGAVGSPGSTVSDNVFADATCTPQEDGTGAIAGDGILQSGES